MIGMLLLFFITDALNVVLSYCDNIASMFLFSDFTKLSAISKGCVLLGIIVYYLLQRNYYKNVFIGAFVIICFAVIGVDFNNREYFITWTIRMSKLCFPFLLFSFIKDNSGLYKSIVLNTYKGLIFIQVLTVILSYIFGWDLFLTYGHLRFGYSGFIIAPNEASFFYIVSSVFLMSSWQNNCNTLDLILLNLVLISSILLGTKAIYIFILSIPFYFSFTRVNKIYLIVGIFISGFLFIGIYFLGVFDFYIEFVKHEGWLTVLTSLRDQLIKERLPFVFSKWTWYNYIFGGVNPATSFVEMDIIDMFTFGGILGSLLYYSFLFKTLFRFSKHNYYGWFLVSQFFIIGGLAGHVFASGINGVYLALTCYYLQTEEKYD